MMVSNYLIIVMFAFFAGMQLVMRNYVMMAVDIFFIIFFSGDYFNSFFEKKDD